MKIGGHSLRQHVRFLAPLFALIAAVWLLRLIVYAAGLPHGLLRVVSVTLVAPVAVLLAALMVHHRKFGSYPNIVASAFLLVAWDQLLVSAAIAFTSLTGIQEVYAAPEYSIGESYALHISGHLTYGIGAGTLFGSAMGCLLLWILRWLVPGHSVQPSLKQSPDGASPVPVRKG